MTRSYRRRGRWLAAPVLAGAMVGACVTVAAGRAGKPPPAGPPPGRLLPPAALSPHKLVEVVDRQAAPPRRIQIPAIGVSARVVPLRLAVGGSMQVPVNTSDTGWFEPGPEPGERGPAVLVGHVDSKTGPSVFFKLGDLRRGGLIRILRADDSVVRFRVQGLERWPKASFPTRHVFGMTRGPPFGSSPARAASTAPPATTSTTRLSTRRAWRRRSVGDQGWRRLERRSSTALTN